MNGRIGITEVLSFCSGAMAALAGAQFGMRFGCFAALATGAVAFAVAFPVGLFAWILVDDLGDTALRVLRQRRTAGVVLVALYVLANAACLLVLLGGPLWLVKRL